MGGAAAGACVAGAGRQEMIAVAVSASVIVFDIGRRCEV